MDKKLARKPALRVFFLLILLAGISRSPRAAAQNGLQAQLERPDFSEFPELKTYLDVFSEDGTFLSGLERGDVQLLEDDQPRELLTLQELHPGVQLVLAVNIAPPFAIQDVTGTSRWGYLEETLSSWASQEQLNADDDLSLITNDGLEKTHLRDRALLAGALARYQPQPRETASNLNVLARALEIASDPPPELGMKRVVILLTPPPSPEDVAALQSLTSLALENQVRVYPWLVSSPAYFNSAGAEQLQALAEETGGKFFAFSGTETIPDLESEFQALRGTYLIKYLSGINTGGEHQLRAVINYQEQEITAARVYSQSILPPNPILISPPQQITRKNPGSAESDLPLTEYRPQNYQLEVLIEFPDELPRPINKSILRVDGEVEAVNHNPPFNLFLWDISRYTNSKTHYISVEVEDTIGLSSTSVRTPIDIQVNQPDLPLSALLSKNTLLFLGLLAAILLFATILILIIRGVIRPREVIGQTGSPNARNSNNKPVHSKQMSVPSGPDREDHLPLERTAPIALLIPEEKPATDLFDQNLPIYEEEITFGRHPSSAIIALPDPSVAELHARLTRISSHSFRIQDQGSLTGTWINYKKLNPNQAGRIYEGDLFHIGRVGFRLQTQHLPGTAAPASFKEYQA
jgi:hypothetical protein